MKKVERLLCAVVVLLVASVAMDSYYLVEHLKYREDRELRYTFNERVSRLDRDQQWSRVLQVSLERQKSMPDDPWGYFWEGIGHFRKKNFDKAEVAFEKAVEKDPVVRNQVDRWLQAMPGAKKNSPQT